MLSTFISYQAITRSLTSSLASTAAEPVVSNETQYYLANIGKVKTVDDFLNNYRLFSYAMKAFGLEDMNYAKGMMRQVLTGGITDPKSLANTLTDPRYKAFATAFDFAAKGAAATSATSAQSGTVSQYVRQTMENDAGTQNDGVRLALYFQRMAPAIKTPLDILADPALLKVVQTVLNIPAASSLQDIDVQANTISNEMNVADLQDPTKLTAFIQRFTAIYDLNNSAANAQTQPANALLVGQGLAGISTDLLTSLQGFKLGGA
ncbi:MAG: DUF1217 domain-containing protein [Hyphomicrobiales bacterium]